MEGAANRACIRAIADALGVAQSRVELRAGQRGRTKTFFVRGIDEDIAAQIALRARVEN